MEDVAIRVLVKYAAPGKVFECYLSLLIVVVCFTLGELFFREGHMKVVVKVTAEGRNPLKAPAHALSDSLDFRNGCPSDNDVTDIVMLQMAASWSRSRVNAFSSTSNALRATSRSSRETASCGSSVILLP